MASTLTSTTKAHAARDTEAPPVKLTNGIAGEPESGRRPETAPATSAPPSTASTLYVVVVLAVVIIFVGTMFWAAMVNTVGPPFSP